MEDEIWSGKFDSEAGGGESGAEEEDFGVF